MKTKTVFCVSLVILVTSFVTVEAQIPCGPTVTPTPNPFRELVAIPLQHGSQRLQSL